MLLFLFVSPKGPTNLVPKFLGKIDYVKKAVAVVITSAPKLHMDPSSSSAKRARFTRAPIETLSVDILGLIFAFLPSCGLIRVVSVISKAWRRVALSSSSLTMHTSVKNLVRGLTLFPRLEQLVAEAGGSPVHIRHSTLRSLSLAYVDRAITLETETF